MASITTRSGKGSPLTNAEVDNNFTNINTELGQKESASNKGVANGYASLDGSGKVPSAQLPSYVDDVVEGANLAALPATGETGKIYVTLDTNKTYRWSGSAYVEISASPGSTDAVTEGSTNLYFTNARARGALSGTAPISYNSTSGAISHAVSGVTAGSYGSSTSVPVITVDATGHVTGVSTSSISGSLTFTGDVTGSGSTGSSTALTLANSGVAAGTYTKVTVDAKGRVTTGASLASGDVTTALGYTPLSNATSYLPLAGGTLTGSVEVTSGQNIRFGHANQSDGNDGKIGAALFGSGLNIVGTQTVANGGRIIRLWGSVQTDAGQTYIHTGNIGSYAPTLSGTGASGTWGISISGNSATTSQRSFSGDISSGGQGRFTGWYSGGAATGQAAEIGMSSGQGYIFVYNRDTGTYGTLNVAASAANMQFSGSTINVTAGSLQHGGNQVLHAGNYTSYSPSLGGSGASGTWGINITGNAATATSATTASNVAATTATGVQSAYQTTINTTTPGLGTYGIHFNGQTTADYASGITWNGGTTTTNANAGIYVQGSGSYGTKMYIATTDSYATGSKTAISIDPSGITNFVRARPTALGNTILDAGNYTSYVGNGTLTMAVSGTGLSGSASFTANQSGASTFTVTSNATTTAGAANTIVARDANGYIFNNYFNSTDNSVASGVTAVVVKQGDNYYRSGTAASIATFISGQTMNISGSSTSCSGNAATATTATYALNTTQGFNSNWNTDFAAAPAGSTILRGDTSTGSSTGGPGGTWWFQQNMRHTNSSNVWGVQVAWGWEDNANTLRTRNVTGGSYGSWVTYLNSANYTSYVSQLTSATNSATLYPNNNVYGSWRVGGTKNGWYGIDFESGVVQMMNRNSMGWYDNSYGWTVYWSGGTLYNYKNANGGGTQAVVLDSSNYTSYVSGGTPTLSVTSSTSFTAAANTHYVIVGGATTVTLPTSPSAGTIVWITVANGRTDTVIARNGQNINSLAENMTVDSAFAGIQLRYADATRGWVFT